MPRRDRINSNVRITGKCGALAQLGERLVCNQEVTGSIPVRSIKQDNDSTHFRPVPNRSM